MMIKETRCRIKLIDYTININTTAKLNLNCLNWPIKSNKIDSHINKLSPLNVVFVCVNPYCARSCACPT